MLLNLIACALFGFVMWHLGRNSCMAEMRKTYATNKNHTEPEESGEPEAIVYEEMVKCEYCGLNLPIAEAVERNGKIYCCAQHASLAEKQN